jgi:hypothetical protein
MRIQESIELVSEHRGSYKRRRAVPLKFEEVPMTLLHRLLCFGIMSAAIAARGLAQTAPESDASPSEKTIRGWLQSGEPRLVAWGAHYLLAEGDSDLVPDLLSVASQWQTLSPQTYSEGSKLAGLSPEQEQERDAMAAVVDTLIQMKATLPGETLRNLAPDFGNAVAVLLGRMPVDEGVPLAFDFYRAEENHVYGLQYVSAALLALRPPPGFAADLLAKTNVHATVFVIMPGSGGMGVGGSADCGSTPNDSQEGWPKTGQYILSKEKSDGAMLLVAGIDPVYAVRRETSHYAGDPCSFVALGPNERVRLIAEMLGNPPKEIPWQTRVVANIEFQSMEQFKIDLLAFVEEQQQMYRATAEELESRGLLEKWESQQSFPLLRLSLSDERGEGVEPISKDSIHLPGRVEWSPSAY